ncbi:MAG: mycothiol synthase [Frankiaceae bacterium]|nr:mycothiol synthase [Frankiaceae bacterium]
MDLPDGYAARPATPDDVAAVCALVIAVDVEEYGEPDYEEADIRDAWGRAGFDIARDTWVVEDSDANVVGYAIAREEQPQALLQAEAFAAPGGPDLYPWLVDAVSLRAAEHAAEAGRTRAHVFNSEPNTRRAAALTCAGYSMVRVFRRMAADLDPAPPALPTLPGVSIRRPEREDLRACWTLNQESFADHFDFAPSTYDAWRSAYVDTEMYRPEYWWLAELDGRPVGLLIGQRHEDDGWVKSLGTLPSARGRGVGTALLLTAFHAFRADGFRRVGLGVDSANSSGAMALYERLGMRAGQRYDCYERTFTGT